MKHDNDVDSRLASGEPDPNNSTRSSIADPLLLETSYESKLPPDQLLTRIEELLARHSDLELPKLEISSRGEERAFSLRVASHVTHAFPKAFHLSGQFHHLRGCITSVAGGSRLEIAYSRPSAPFIIILQGAVVLIVLVAVLLSAIFVPMDIPGLIVLVATGLTIAAGAMFLVVAQVRFVELVEARAIERFLLDALDLTKGERQVYKRQSIFSKKASSLARPALTGFLVILLGALLPTIYLGRFLQLDGSKMTPMTMAQLKTLSGRWVAPDGDFVVIRKDGSGDCKLSNPDLGFTNARVSVSGSTLTIGFPPLVHRFHIDRAPIAASTRPAMTLDGKKFEKSDRLPETDSAREQLDDDDDRETLPF